MAKRGYTRDTIRGGASDWDVSRPFSSYLRTLGSLLVHPVQFFDRLPRVQDVRAPGLFLAFSGFPAALFWLVAAGPLPAVAALAAPLPLSVALAALYHLGSFGGRHGFIVTWRVLAYPLGFYLPLSAVPGLRWVAGFYAGAVLLAVGLSVVREVTLARAFLVSLAITGALAFGIEYLSGLSG